MVGTNSEQKIKNRIRACDYLTVAQLFLQDNFLLDEPLKPEHIKPRLLGHWGTCPGINIVYTHLKATLKDFQFILGPGHGFPALQANLFIDGDLAKVDPLAAPNLDGIKYICKNFSWPGGFPSHSSPITPGVISEGGELGYALATAYGAALGAPTKTIAVLIGDGELETATASASLHLPKLLSQKNHGRVLPILHLNGYKISAPTLPARSSERELHQLLRGCGYTPLEATPDTLSAVINQALTTAYPFIIFRSEKGVTGPEFLNNQKIAGNYLSHQIPLASAKTDPTELALLEDWLKSYKFTLTFSPRKGFAL